ncbi:MAG: dTDP-4-dehydrorhamnose 3,5-epimerase [Actinomycetota bacterium]
MATEIVDFRVQSGALDGLVVIELKRASDERGSVRELFRRSAFEQAGITLAPFDQINITESRRGAVRGMHAESMTKLVSVAAGEVFAAFVDLRDDSPTRGAVTTVEIRPGVQVLVPSGVGNGFQTVTEVSQYVYCFDREWSPGMPGRSVTPLDPALGVDWPISIDPTDRALVSAKDVAAPLLRDVIVAEAPS